MTVPELIQTLRTISIAEFRKQATAMQKSDPAFYDALCHFVSRCQAQPSIGHPQLTYQIPTADNGR